MSALAAQAIGTGRLDLLPLRVEHAEEMAAVLGDPALHTFIGGAPDTPRSLRSRYERMTAGSPDPDVTWLNWVIRVRAAACLAGTVQATVSPSAPAPGGSRGSDATPGAVAEIAWVVGTPWQGRGIATEAARGLVDWLAGQPVSTVTAHVHPDHRASAAVAAAVGLTPTDEWHDGERRWRRTLARGSAPRP
ncbi:GNAT family N-acetyltransferase [Streptomyces sp. V4-01]|uniref:GNAT family N-acetyltransferase n=1 Tax=Actinacidiphila polyblastidii TaxID=3110430 RepID=A0ABU7PL88_9ACTN|nr:GNAT family N-acetyltransferase [Streptomyces sp. V4-01]